MYVEVVSKNITYCARRTKTQKVPHALVGWDSHPLNTR